MRFKLPTLDCAGCRKCCKGDEVVLVPEVGDDPGRWRTVKRPDGRHALLRDGAGNCVYLGAKGCTIHHRARPHACQVYDCRIHVLMLSRDPTRLAALSSHPQAGPVIREGQRRLAEIQGAE